MVSLRGRACLLANVVTGAENRNRFHETRAHRHRYVYPRLTKNPFRPAKTTALGHVKPTRLRRTRYPLATGDRVSKRMYPPYRCRKLIGPLVSNFSPVVRDKRTVIIPGNDWYYINPPSHCFSSRLQRKRSQVIPKRNDHAYGKRPSERETCERIRSSERTSRHLHPVRTRAKMGRTKHSSRAPHLRAQARNQGGPR